MSDKNKHEQVLKSRGRLSKWQYLQSEASYNRIDEHGESQAAIWRSEIEKKWAEAYPGIAPDKVSGYKPDRNQTHRWEWVCDGDSRMDEWMSHRASSVDEAKSNIDRILADAGWMFEDEPYEPDEQ